MSDSDKADGELDTWLSTLAGAKTASPARSASLLRTAMLASAEEHQDSETETSLAAVRARLLAAARRLPDATLEARRALREQAAKRLLAGHYVESIAVKAAAEHERLERLPRLRTPDGFVLTPLYSVETTTPGSATGLLIECPDDLLETFAGCLAGLKVGDRVIELGVFSAAGKVIAELPVDLELRPPLIFFVLPGKGP